MTTAIEFNNISKLYRLGLVSTGTMVHDLKRWWTMNVKGDEDPYLTIGETNDRSIKGESDYVWALKDIDFKVEQGDVVGIIGKNGAGKSTLLKLLSKVTAPTTGTIKAKGRIGSLLEVGTGFHPEMTGRENIYLNGAILGMTRQEVTRKLDEIVDFSGCERYIDTPVKRYSSGMMVRLGFAVAAHLDPEILVVDEVLAVGDAEFQNKAIGKIQNVSKDEGRTVLFVSHNMTAVRNLCNNGILLSRGCIDFIGGACDAINRYLGEKSVEACYIPSDSDTIVKKVSVVQRGPKITIALEYDADNPIIEPILGFVIYDSYDSMIFGSNPLIEKVDSFGYPKKKGIVKATFDNPVLCDGRYYISIWFNDGKSSGKHVFEKERCLSIDISDMQTERERILSNYLGPIVPSVSYEFA